MRVKNILRNVFGGMFIFSGITGMFTGEVLYGMVMVLFGISLLPIFYEKTTLNKYKNIQIILPIVLFFITCMVVPSDTVQDDNINNETFANLQEQEVIELTSLRFNETNLQIDIKETKDILLEIMPVDSDISELEFISTNLEVVKVEKNLEKSSENEIYMKVIPMGEGECELYVSSNNIESNRIKVVIVDNDKIENEENTSEKTSITTTQKNSTTSQNTTTQQETSSSTSQSTTQQNTSSATSQTTTTQQNTNSSTSQSNSNNSNGKIIYKTPTGKRYHYDPDCAGPNAEQTTLSAALSAGLTACKTCVE